MLDAAHAVFLRSGISRGCGHGKFTGEKMTDRIAGTKNHRTGQKTVGT